MVPFCTLLFLVNFILQGAESFQRSWLIKPAGGFRITNLRRMAAGDSHDSHVDANNVSRRLLLTAGSIVITSVAAGTAPAVADDAVALPTDQSDGLTVFKTKSGLKYVDLEPGTGPTPSYGQLLSISYTGYVKLPASKDEANPKPEMFEKESSFLLKHGNGRTIAGLDEGLHTMRVGGLRRLLIPPKLGFTDIGLGPVPTYPWDRAKLNNLLRKMVDLVGGTLIYEVRLVAATDDEADQGYYEDDSLSPEEFEQLRNSLQKQARAARDEGMI